MKKVWVARVVMERARAILSNSGVYTCTNTCTAPINLTLHVLMGEYSRFLKEITVFGKIMIFQLFNHLYEKIQKVLTQYKE